MRIRVGDLVRTSAKWMHPHVLGVVVDITSQSHLNRVGVSWPDDSQKVVFQPIVWLEVVDSHEGDN